MKGAVYVIGCDMLLVSFQQDVEAQVLLGFTPKDNGEERVGHTSSPCFSVGATPYWGKGQRVIYIGIYIYIYLYLYTHVCMFACIYIYIHVYIYIYIYIHMYTYMYTEYTHT